MVKGFVIRRINLATALTSGTSTIELNARLLFLSV